MKYFGAVIMENNNQTKLVTTLHYFLHPQKSPIINCRANSILSESRGNPEMLRASPIDKTLLIHNVTIPVLQSYIALCCLGCNTKHLFSDKTR